MRCAQPRAPQLAYDSRCIVPTIQPTIVQLDMPVCRIALGRLSCCGARAQAGEIQLAALHTMSVADSRTAGERQLASRPTLSYRTGPRRRDARGAHPHLPTVLQDELQSDPLRASLEETKAKVEKCSTVSGRLDMAEC